jgi:hypothetical protein
MSKLEYLREQEARARRLAGTITDATTIERFLEFAAACRQQIAEMSQAAEITGLAVVDTAM